MLGAAGAERRGAHSTTSPSSSSSSSSSSRSSRRNRASILRSSSTSACQASSSGDGSSGSATKPIPRFCERPRTAGCRSTGSNPSHLCVAWAAVSDLVPVPPPSLPARVPERLSTLEDLAAGWLMRFGPNTRDAYARDLGRWLEWCSGLGVDPPGRRHPPRRRLQSLPPRDPDPRTGRRLAPRASTDASRPSPASTATPCASEP